MEWGPRAGSQPHLAVMSYGVESQLHPSEGWHWIGWVLGLLLEVWVLRANRAIWVGMAICTRRNQGTLCRLLQRQNYNLTSSGKKPWKCCFFHPLKGLGSFNPLQALFCPYSNCYPCFKCQRTEILLLIKSIGTHFPLCEGARKTKQ